MSTGGALRRKLRVPLNARVRLTWEDEKGSPNMCYGRCSDISESGMSMEVEHSIPLRSYVHFRMEEIQFEGSGSVRYVSRKGLKHYVGIEFSGMLRWDGAK